MKAFPKNSYDFLVADKEVFLLDKIEKGEKIMSKRMLVEVHVGKRYGISRLNCDGAGQVKDVIIDNERYNRISSQSKKKV